MTWIKLPKRIPLMKDLMRIERQSREERVSVVPIPGYSATIDRKVLRPWKPLPNIQDFVIKLSSFDWLTSLFGFNKKYDPKLTLHQWKNGNANKYVDYMFKRLKVQVQKEMYHEAVDTIWILMNSTAYQVVAINHVMKNWHRKLTWKDILLLSKQVRKLARNRSTNINYSRTYIPKGETVRPLGVPTPAWRVYLHMYNNCIVEWRNVTEANKQHGYLPGKGVISAWMVLTRMLDKPNLYEADFQGFFNNVRHIGIYRELTKIGLPEMEALFIWNLNNSVVKLTDKDLIDEPHRAFTVDPKNPEAMYCGRTEYTLWTSFETGFIDLYEMGCFDDDVPLKGVPQGAPTSCSMSTITLRKLEEENDILFYADDVILSPKSSSEDPIKILTDEEYGLIVNEEKSRWLKKNGKWVVKSFKFLGIRYYPARYTVDWEESLFCLPLTITLDLILGLPLLTFSLCLASLPRRQRERFEADTRKGANLEFTGRESFLSYLAIARELLLNSKYLKGKWESLTLVEWLEGNYHSWKGLKSQAKLLFASTKKSFAQLQSSLKEWEELLEVTRRRSKEIKSELDVRDVKKLEAIIEDVKRNRGVDNPLTGFFVSRMQSNSWQISVEQDFRLSYIKGSWTDTQWGRYSWDEILPRNRINVFVSSSFAVHDLMNEIRRQKRKEPIRKVAI